MTDIAEDRLEALAARFKVLKPIPSTACHTQCADQGADLLRLGDWERMVTAAAETMIADEDRRRAWRSSCGHEGHAADFLPEKPGSAWTASP